MESQQWSSSTVASPMVVAVTMSPALDRSEPQTPCQARTLDEHRSGSAWTKPLHQTHKCQIWFHNCSQVNEMIRRKEILGCSYGSSSLWSLKTCNFRCRQSLEFTVDYYQKHKLWYKSYIVTYFQEKITAIICICV